MEAEFPKRTADDCTLPNGVTIWVQTLNAYHRSEADRDANYAAALKMQRFRPKQPLYEYYKTDFEAMPEDALLEFLADAAIASGRVHVEAAMKHFMPVLPERREQETDPAFVERVTEYEVQVAQVIVDREAYVKNVRDTAFERYRSMKKAERIKECMSALIQTEFAREYAQRSQFEILQRAVRTKDNHLEFYFKSWQEVADLDDDVLAKLTQKYNELDSVKPDTIPTLPDES